LNGWPLFPFFFPLSLCTWRVLREREREWVKFFFSTASPSRPRVSGGKERKGEEKKDPVEERVFFSGIPPPPKKFHPPPPTPPPCPLLKGGAVVSLFSSFFSPFLFFFPPPQEEKGKAISRRSSSFSPPSFSFLPFPFFPITKWKRGSEHPSPPLSPPPFSFPLSPGGLVIFHYLLFFFFLPSFSLLPTLSLPSPLPKGKEMAATSIFSLYPHLLSL